MYIRENIVDFCVIVSWKLLYLCVANHNNYLLSCYACCIVFIICCYRCCYCTLLVYFTPIVFVCMYQVSQFMWQNNFNKVLGRPRLGMCWQGVVAIQHISRYQRGYYFPEVRLENLPNFFMFKCVVVFVSILDHGLAFCIFYKWWYIHWTVCRIASLLFQTAWWQVFSSILLGKPKLKLE